MKITAALVKEQGVTFAVVLVKPMALRQAPSDKNNLTRSYQPLFPGVPIVLCAQTPNGGAEYWGRSDIVNFLAGVAFEQLPWAEWVSSAA